MLAVTRGRVIVMEREGKVTAVTPLASSPLTVLAYKMTKEEKCLIE